MRTMKMIVPCKRSRKANRALLRAAKTAINILREWNAGEEEPPIFHKIDRAILNAERYQC